MYEKLKNKNLRQIIEGDRILKSKVLRKNNENQKWWGTCSHKWSGSSDWSIFAVNKRNKQTYSKVTEQI